MPPLSWSKIFRQQVARQKHPRRAINNIRHQLGNGDPQGIFQELRKHPMFLQNISVSAEPRNFSDIWNSLRLVSQGLIEDVLWTSEVVSIYEKSISKFILAEKKFDEAYLFGDWNLCLSVLDDLEKESGLSLWLISRRITVLKRAPNIEEEDYATKLIANTSDGTVISWLVYMMSLRSDPNFSPTSYVKKINSSINDVGLPNEIVYFLRYHALSIPPRNIEEAISVISISETLPIIDRYISLIDSYQFIVGNFIPNSTERLAVKENINRISKTISDDRLSLLDEINSPEKNDRLLKRVKHHEADLYTKGAYEDAIKALSDLIRQSPEHTNLYDLLASSSLRASTPLSLPEPILSFVQAMAAVQSFNKEEDSRLIELSREQLSGAHRMLCSTIRRLFTSLSEDLSESYLDANVEALNSSIITPLQLRILPIYDRKNLLLKAELAFPDSISLELQNAILDFGNCELPASLQERLPPDRSALYSARALLRISRVPEALNLLEKLESNTTISVANDARRELFRAYMTTSQYREALRLVARAYQYNERLHTIFKIQPLLEAVESSASGPPFEEISLSICYHVTNRFGGDQSVGAQADAAEEFLFTHRVELPSALDFEVLEADRKLFTIYLDQVCVPATLDKFMAIESVSQVEIERLAICRILSEIDPSNRQRYLDEIRDITRRRVVRDRFEQVERTKIYVDTDGIKRQAEKNLRESYQRFASSNIDENSSSERIEMFRRVQQVLSEVKNDGVKIHIRDLPMTESDQIFDRLVDEVMQLLVSSQEYGLEAYLSTRVRHGTMGNQLRSAFEVQSLLTQKDNGEYQPDKHWADTLGLENSREGLWLAQRLAKFSEDVDSLIEDLVRKRVQVRSETTPDGLFFLQKFNYGFFRLQSEITAETSFDTFLDKVIDQFWNILEFTLGHVRKYIETIFIESAHKLTDELEKDVVKSITSNNLPLRDAIAAARTQMSTNVANVANWFTLARDMERQDYEFGIAVEVAIESIRVCHPSLDVNLERSDNITFECRGKTLESLVYILFTALDNALEHSGFIDHSPSLMLETRLKDNWLELCLVNSCAEITNVDEKNEHLLALRNRLEDGKEAQGLANIEGGSGYAKIIRIIRHDLLTPHFLKFGYRSSTEYAVTIGMDAKVILK